MQQSARFRAIEAELPNALSGAQMLLFFQPILDLKKRAVSGYEALLRWNNPRMGWLEPAEFIPVAATTGSILAIGSWVLVRSCAQARRWPAAAFAGVNISKSELLHPQFFATVETALEKARLSPGRLTLEIAETTYFETRDEAAAVLAALRERGVHIAIDEATQATLDRAGMGPLPIDGLKIARHLIADLGSIFSKPADQETIRGLVAWGERLGLPVVGTGIENDAQLSFLRDCGANLAQGFHIGRPLPADEEALAAIAV
jgi:EAL domain-containing protein (putative c-di-GMP-specific phosphodiesterase class I)